MNTYLQLAYACVHLFRVRSISIETYISTANMSRNARSYFGGEFNRVVKRCMQYIGAAKLNQTRRKSELINVNRANSRKKRNVFIRVKKKQQANLGIFLEKDAIRSKRQKKKRMEKSTRIPSSHARPHKSTPSNCVSFCSDVFLFFICQLSVEWN